MSQNGQALPRINYHDPPHLNTNHSHLHLITTAITTLIRAPVSVHSVVRSCGSYKDRYATEPSAWVYLPEYLTCYYLPPVCLSLPDTWKAVDTRDLRALRDLCLQRTCQRHRSSVRIPAHSPLYVQERPLTALEEVHHCCYWVCF